MHSNQFFVIAALPFLAAAWPTFDSLADSSVNYTSIFAPGLSSGASIHYPKDADYNTTTVQRWSTWEQPTFVVTIKPATNKDVQYIINTATQHNFTFFATGGAHSGETGFGTVKQAVNIDLSNFQQNELNVSKNRLTVGPGISFVDFEEKLYNAGKIVPTGNSFCVNMIGATIGAGYGPFQGLHGLIIDALRCVTIVTASGEILEASATTNTDLFWAVRGAGANFGVITSATYEVYDAPNNGNVVLADFAFPGAANISLFELLGKWDTTYPKEAGLTVVGAYSQSTRTSAMSATLSFFGTQSEAQPWIDQLKALGPTKFQNSTIPWSSLSASSGFGNGGVPCVRGVYNNHPSVGANKTNAVTYTSVFNQLVENQRTRPWLNSPFVVQRFNTAATLAVPAKSQGVYPYREISSLIVIENYYSGPSYDAEVTALWQPLRSQLAATSGFGSLKTYINYAYGDEGPANWYGLKNLPRLSKLKAKYDPQQKFGAGNPIPVVQ